MIFLQVKGRDYPTADGTCIRDYIDVTDLVDAHVKALNKAEPRKVGIYNVGTGRGLATRDVFIYLKVTPSVPNYKSFQVCPKSNLSNFDQVYRKIYQHPQCQMNALSKYISWSI